jgi:HEAT repeat protein
MSALSLLRYVLIVGLSVGSAPVLHGVQATRSSGSKPAQAQREPSVAVEEAVDLTNGWARLAEGKPEQALIQAMRVLQREPRSIGGLVLAVEADIANHGAAAGLAQYEHWLAARPFEETGVVRRIARAMLVEEARQRVDQGARAEAIRALSEIGDPRATREVRETVAVSPVAAGTRASLGDPRAVDALVSQLNQGGSGLVTTIDALGKSGSPRAIPALVARLQDPRQEVRAASLEALGQLGDADVVPQVAPLLADRNMRVRVTAAGALLQLGDSSGIPLLQGLLTDPDPSVRLLAADALKSQPDAGWLAVVRELATSEDPEVRARAARLLGPHDPAFARSVLEGLSNDDNPAIREMAAMDMSEVTTTDLTTLRGMLRNESHLTRAKAAAQIVALTK